MGKNSVTWAYAASVPLATAAIFVCFSISDRGARADLDGAPSHLNPPTSTSHPFHLSDVGDSSAVIRAACEATIPGKCGYVVSLPRNSLVVVGSLDLSGAPHIVSVDSNLPGFDSLHVRPTNPHQSERNCARLSSSDITPPEGTRIAPTTPVRDLPPSSNDVNFCGVPSCRPAAATLSVPQGPRIRRFLVPHFERTTMVNEAGDAILVAQSARVSVYLDHLLYSAGMEPRNLATGSQMIERANEVCRHLEATVIDHVSMWVGEVADLDGDRKLSVVITDLDRRSPVAEALVLGCVRDSDFLGYHETNLSGDIVYLDSRIPDGKSLAGLLAHELTHAAVFSLILQSRASLNENGGFQIPSWLNEATAHLVEGSVCEAPAGFAERVRQFRTDSASSPIVASESYLSFSARRGGSRASGVLFLRQLAESPDDLRSVIQSSEPIDRRIESITGQSFSEIFRVWSAEEAQNAQICASTNSRKFAGNGDRFSHRVFGTAFFCFRCEEPVQNMLIASDSKAELQITVIEQPPDSHRK